MTVYGQWDELSEYERIEALLKMDMSSLHRLGDDLTDSDDEAYIEYSDNVLYEILFSGNMNKDMKKILAEHIAKHATKEQLLITGAFVCDESNSIFVRFLNFDPIFKDGDIIDPDITALIEKRRSDLKAEKQAHKKWVDSQVDKYAKTEIDRLFLKEAGYYALEGRATAQIPSLSLEINADGVTYLDAHVVQIEKLFEEQLIAWKTRKGWVHTPECRNPKTGRRLSGSLFITEKGFDIYEDALYNLYKEGCKKNEWPFSGYPEWRDIMIKSIKQKR